MQFSIVVIFHDMQRVAAARGEAVAITVNSARIATPGLVDHTLRALGLGPSPTVSALSLHLGPDVQNKTVTNGYDQETEDALLEESRWREDGYVLFGISTLAQSSRRGFPGGVPPESSWVAGNCLPSVYLWIAHADASSSLVS